MSLTVPPALLEQAQQGAISEEDFLACVRTSLPYAWSVVAGTAEKLNANGGTVEINDDVPQNDKEWGQLFRMMASDSIRAAIERKFGVRLAFQNCCKVAAFAPDATAAYDEFTSMRAQVLNQRPELVDC
ncbi:SCO5389 family protein [Amycolatopsis sp. NPDC021455]|uniref:SCO5389 family protein n=1 Tax=Amycolatopsis sp. NPDC021455 TaxID=3154901 RepID=UPI0033ED8D45